MKRRQLWLTLCALAAAAFGQPWTEMAPMPIAMSGEMVNSGGCLAVDTVNAVIFAAKGHRTSDFYSYDIAGNNWMVRSDVPLGVEAKPVDDGGSMVYDGYRYLYLVKGNYTLGFWRYDIQNDSWRQMQDVPLGIHGTKVSGGTDMVFARPGGHGYIYLLKGHYNEFYRYFVDGQHWEEMPPAPVGLNERWGDGSWLASDGDHTIYAHKAEYHEFWTFDVAAGAWDANPRSPLPLVGRNGHLVKAGDGSCGAWHDGSIFVSKGNNTIEFWEYVAARDSWVERETMPSLGSTGRVKKVRNGGDIVPLMGRFYALKGNYCNEFWRYTPAPTSAEERSTSDAQRRIQTATVVRGVLELSPSPFPLPAGEGQGVRERAVLLDASGRPVMSLLPGPNDVRHLAPGIYFIREESQVTGHKSQVVRRVVLMR